MTYFYELIRHPIYLGLLVGLWCTPRMTLGHLLFAAGMSAYILIGIRFEERDLEVFIGAEYQRYKQRAPMLIPRLAMPHETVKAVPGKAQPLAH